MAILDREPIIHKLSDRVRGRLHKIRDRPNQAIKNTFPEFEERNLGQGTAAGAALAAVGVILEDTLGLPFGASSDIVQSEPQDNGVVYTVNVNAPLGVMAEGRAIVDSGTGFTTFITEFVDVETIEIQKMRALRDTYQVEVFIEE